MWFKRRPGSPTRRRSMTKLNSKREARRRWRLAFACIRFIVMLQVRARHGVKLTARELQTLDAAFRAVCQTSVIAGVHGLGALLERLGHAKPPDQLQQLLTMVNHEEGQILKFPQAQKIVHRLKQNFVLTRTTEAEDAFLAIGGVGDSIAVNKIGNAVQAFGIAEPIPSGPQPFAEAPPDGEEPQPYQVSFYEFAALVGEVPPPSVQIGADIVVSSAGGEGGGGGIGGGGGAAYLYDSGNGRGGRDGHEDDDDDASDFDHEDFGTRTRTGSTCGADVDRNEDLDRQSASLGNTRRSRVSLGATAGRRSDAGRSSQCSATLVPGPTPLEKFMARAQRQLSPDAPRVGIKALKKKRELIAEQLRRLPKQGVWRMAATSSNDRTIEYELKPGFPYHLSGTAATSASNPASSSITAYLSRSVGVSPIQHDQAALGGATSTSQRPSSALARTGQRPSSGTRMRPSSATTSHARSPAAAVSAVSAGALPGSGQVDRRRPASASFTRSATSQRIHNAVDASKLWQLAAEPSFAMPAEQRIAIMNRYVMQNLASRESIKGMPIHDETRAAAAALMQLGLGSSHPADVTNDRRSRSPHRRTLASDAVIRPSSSHGREYFGSPDAEAAQPLASFYYPVVGKPSDALPLGGARRTGHLLRV